MSESHPPVLQFIDTQAWPEVRLSMPEQIPDAQTESYMAKIAELYARQQRFVLYMTGADLPHHSPVFMNRYLQWTRDNLGLQQRYCAGAIRIEADDMRREKYQQWSQNLTQSGQAPYGYFVVATEAEARALAAKLLDNSPS